MRDKGSAHQEYARQVRIEYRPPFGQREVDNGFADVDAGVVDEGMDLLESSDDVDFKLADLRFVGDIRHKHFRLDTQGAGFDGDAFQLVAVAGDECESRALAGEGQSHRFAQALTGTSDQGGLSRESLIGHAVTCLDIGP